MESLRVRESGSSGNEGRLGRTSLQPHPLISKRRRIVLQYLTTPPFLGDKSPDPERKHEWNDPDPTWYSEVHKARLVKRTDMLAALERHGWTPRGLSSEDVEALKAILERPSRPPPGSAKVATAPPSRKRGLDASDSAKPAASRSRKQPSLRTFLLHG